MRRPASPPRSRVDRAIVGYRVGAAHASLAPLDADGMDGSQVDIVEAERCRLVEAGCGRRQRAFGRIVARKNLIYRGRAESDGCRIRHCSSFFASISNEYYSPSYVMRQNNGQVKSLRKGASGFGVVNEHPSTLYSSIQGGQMAARIIDGKKTAEDIRRDLSVQDRLSRRARNRSGAWRSFSSARIPPPCHT
jgi:hypothetical protein